MSVYKEIFYAAQEVHQKSQRIYPDAADCGVPIYSKSDKIIQYIKATCEMYNAKISTVKYDAGATQTLTVKAMDEWNTGNAVDIIFTYVHSNKGLASKTFPNAIGYLYVNEDFLNYWAILR